jgi:hypothetical protein
MKQIGVFGRNAQGYIPRTGKVRERIITTPEGIRFDTFNLAGAINSFIVLPNSNRHNKYTSFMTWISPLEFRYEQYKAMNKFNYDRGRDSKEYQTEIRQMMADMQKGDVFPILYLEYDVDGHLDSQEGRRRCAALEQLGIRKIPVWVLVRRVEYDRGSRTVRALKPETEQLVRQWRAAGKSTSSIKKPAHVPLPAPPLPARKELDTDIHEARMSLLHAKMLMRQYRNEQENIGSYSKKKVAKNKPVGFFGI